MWLPKSAQEQHLTKRSRTTITAAPFRGSGRRMSGSMKSRRWTVSSRKRRLLKRQRSGFRKTMLSLRYPAYLPGDARLTRSRPNQHCLNLEIDEGLALYRYVFYCVCRSYDDMISKKQGARGDLNSTLILSTVIPLPSLDRQREIVGLLDQFDKLCNDLADGLPAEIEARRQQYEYYRDKLLAFEAQ